MTTTQEHRSVDERRAQLVDAALAVMTADGVRGVTTRAVTARAGLPHGAFHYCFGSKAELFRAVLDRNLRRSMAVSFATGSGEQGLAERIGSGLRGYLDRVRDGPDVAMALAELTALCRRDPLLTELARWEQAEYVHEVRRNLERWSALGDVAWHVPVDHVARVMVALADGAASAWLSDRDDAAAEATVAAGADAVAALVDEVPR